MARRVSYALVVLGVLVAVIGLLVPVSGTVEGSTTDVSCGTAMQAAFGTVDDGDQRIMTGTDTAISKSAWCEGEAGDVLRPALAAATVLIILGAMGIVTSFVMERRRRATDPQSLG